MGAIRSDHQPPTHGVGIAKTQKGQARLEQDRDANRQGRRYDQGGRCIGQDHGPDDAAVLRADGSGGGDIFQLLDLHDLGPGQARGLRPADHADGHGDGEQRGRKQGDKHHGEQQRGQDLKELGDPHQQVVHPAAIETRQRAHADADHHGDRSGCRAHRKGRPAARDQPGKDVAPQIVGPEREVRRHTGGFMRGPDNLERVAAIEERAPEGGQNDPRQHHDTGKRRDVAPEHAPGLARGAFGLELGHLGHGLLLPAASSCPKYPGGVAAQRAATGAGPHCHAGIRARPLMTSPAGADRPAGS